MELAVKEMTLAEKIKSKIPAAPDKSEPGHDDYFKALGSLEQADSGTMGADPHLMINYHPYLTDFEKTCLHASVNIKIDENGKI